MLYNEAAEAAIGAVLQKKQPKRISTAEEDACYRAVPKACNPGQVSILMLLMIRHCGWDPCQINSRVTRGWPTARESG
eukprot:1153750-Pelagomonas_calceolata.AAC.14